MAHTKYSHAVNQRDGYCLEYSKDFDCFFLYDCNHSMIFPSSFYLGERCLYLTPGRDHSVGGGFRGNLSDDWPCHDFGMDLKSALEWLHEAEEPDETLYLWTTNPDYK